VLDEPNHLVEYADHILNIDYQNVFFKEKKKYTNIFCKFFTYNNLVDIRFEDLLENMFVVYQELFDKQHIVNMIHDKFLYPHVNKIDQL
jgi:hypothetical protein